MTDIVQRLELGVSSQMARASAELCDLKIVIDRHARRGMKQDFLNDWMGHNNSCAFHGSTFAELVVPFLEWIQGDSKPFRALVDPAYVLGASIKGFPEHIRGGDIATRAQRYATDFEWSNRAQYAWFRPLGLLIAHEGKHRVAFMRAHNQPEIAAWVWERDYPAAERLKLIRPESDQDEWFAILDDRYIQVVLRPHVTRELLSAYGVKEFSWAEAGDFPSQSAVRVAINDRRRHKSTLSRAESDRTLDLEDVRTIVADDNALKKFDLSNVQPYRFQWRPYLLATVLSGLIGAPLVNLDYPLAERMGWMLLGGCVAFVFALHLIHFIGPNGAHRVFQRSESTLNHGRHVPISRSFSKKRPSTSS